MGARQSKRSVDITTTPKKGEGDGGPAEGEGVGKVEKIAEIDIKAAAATNGAAVHPAENGDADDTATVCKLFFTCLQGINFILYTFY